ncbi:MAG: transposase, partial [Anaerolineaceae bacterium]|nr:transposase [Anaerolineaceae bacterium]
PGEFEAGFGPRLSAFIVELAGIAGNSRDMVQRFCTSVLRTPISLGAIQKVIDRASKAIEPHYEACGDKARTSEVNHIDETPWFKGGKLNWLWVMTNPVVAFFMIHTNRSGEAFEKLIGALLDCTLKRQKLAVFFRNKQTQRESFSDKLARYRWLNTACRPGKRTTGTPIVFERGNGLQESSPLTSKISVPSPFTQDGPFHFTRTCPDNQSTECIHLECHPNWSMARQSATISDAMYSDEYHQIICNSSSIAEAFIFPIYPVGACAIRMSLLRLQVKSIQQLKNAPEIGLTRSMPRDRIFRRPSI